MTGELFHNRDKGGGVRKSTLAGCVSKSTGYRVLEKADKKIYAHRYIWGLVYGETPCKMDHINGNRLDNRLCNLRTVTDQESSRNTAIRSDNTSGYTGITWKKDRSKWRSAIFVSGKDIHLGYFDDWHTAFNVRKTAEVKYGFHPNHGAFNREVLHGIR